MCQLGEDTTAAVLLSWDERSPGTTGCVLEFLALQLRVHHPHGARTLAEGAMWVDQAQWCHQLVRLLQNLVETTIGNRLRQNKTRGAKTAAAYELAAELVDLAADIYRQTLAIVGSSEALAEGPADALCDVTQIVPELDATAAPPSQKRPRLDGEERGGRRGVDLSWRGLLERTVYGTETDLAKIPQVLVRVTLYITRSGTNTRNSGSGS